MTARHAASRLPVVPKKHGAVIWISGELMREAIDLEQCIAFWRRKQARIKRKREMMGRPGR